MHRLLPLLALLWIAAPLQAVAQPLRSSLRSALPASRAEANEAEQRLRFWPVAGAGLLGGAVGGALGLMVGEINLADIGCERPGARRCDYDDDDPVIPAFLPGAWLGTVLGVFARSRIDPVEETGALWIAGGSAVLGSVAGASLGTVLTDGSTLGGGAGFLLGSAGLAAFSLWALAEGSRSGRSALLEAGEDGLHLRLPRVERRRVPFTAQRGWSVALFGVQM